MRLKVTSANEEKWSYGKGEGTIDGCQFFVKSTYVDGVLDYALAKVEVKGFDTALEIRFNKKYGSKVGTTEITLYSSSDKSIAHAEAIHKTLGICISIAKDFENWINQNTQPE